MMRLDHIENRYMPLEIPLRGYKKGDRLTIMNTISRRFRDEKDRFHELLDIVFKDCNTGIKHVEEIVDPEYEFYIIKNGEHVDYNRLFIEKDKVESRTVLHRELDKEVSDAVGMKTWYYDQMSSGNKSEVRKIHTHPDVFFSDMNIEDHYRFWFNKNFVNEQCDITKAFLDIEVDGINAAGDFPELGECPVNAVTVCFQEQKQVYTLLLRNPRNPLIAEFEQFINNTGTSDLHDFIMTNVAGQRSNKKNATLGLENFNYSIAFFDEDKELDMIATVFQLINSYVPDMIMAWNMAFDIPYMIERCKVLRGDPALIMSHSDFKHKFANYYIDERNRNDPGERGDFAMIASYTTYLDQMIQFASRRKGQTAFPSMSLDSIGEAIAGVRKLSYKTITTDILKLPYLDYKTFVYYNVMDVIVQYCIESEVEDINYVFGKSLVNNTRYSKVHRQTVYLANRGAKEFYEEGLILGNNANKFGIKPTEKFPGALVADPLLLSNYSKMVVNGYHVLLFENADDFDFKSLYPSLIRQFNVAAHTQVGMLIIPDKIYEMENKRHSNSFTRGGAFFEDLAVRNWFNVGSRWFGLMDYESLVNYVKYICMTEIKPKNYLIGFENSTGIKSIPVIDKSYPIYPLIIRAPMGQQTKDFIEEYTENVRNHSNQSF